MAKFFENNTLSGELSGPYTWLNGQVLAITNVHYDRMDATGSELFDRTIYQGKSYWVILAFTYLGEWTRDVVDFRPFHLMGGYPSANSDGILAYHEFMA